MHPVRIIAASLVVTLAAAVLVAAATARAPEGAATWKIALTTDREGDSEIYSLNANGTGVRRLTHSKKYDGAGPWSPDGRRMLFYSQRSPMGDVWVMNANGSGQRNLTRNPARVDDSLAWSPTQK